MAIATGQFTITDYNDAPIITSWISTNSSKTQGYYADNNTYAPDYTISPMNLKASLFISGTSVDILDSPEGVITNMQWSVVIDGNESNIPGANTRSLTVKTNLVDENNRQYIFKCNFMQESTGLSVPVRATIDINKVLNGSGIADAVILAPMGNIFKNGDRNTLPAECQLWVGSSVCMDVTGNSFRWWKMEGEGTGGEHGVGAGWTKVVSGESGYTIDFNNSTKTSTLTIPKSAVYSTSVFMCTVEDPDNKKIFRETINFLDTTDPIYVEIFSPGGNVFKNNTGSTVLTAKVYQNGVEIDTSLSGVNKYTYTWYQYDKDGNPVDRKMRVLQSKAAISSGKQLQVTHEDINVKATFLCEIS